MYEFTCYHCVLYAVRYNSLNLIVSSSPSAAHPPGQRHPCAPLRHCSTSKHRRMIAYGGLRRRLRRAVFGSASGGHLRRAILHLRRHLRRAVLDGACGWRGGLRRRLRRAVSGSACGGPGSEPTYRTRLRPVSLLTVRRLIWICPVSPAVWNTTRKKTQESLKSRFKTQESLKTGVKTQDSTFKMPRS